MSKSFNNRRSTGQGTLKRIEGNCQQAKNEIKSSHLLLIINIATKGNS